MVDVISLGSIVLLGLVVLVVAAVWVFVRYFSDKYETEWIPNIVVIVSMSIIIITELLVPLDIYVVSSGYDVAPRQKALQILYFVGFSLILFLCFGLLPFTYFYYEERDTEVTTKQRVFAGLKFTIFLVLMLAVLLVLGIVFTGGTPSASSNTSDYIHHLLSSEGPAEKALLFALGSLALLGAVFLVFYTAFGLSAFPIGLMRGTTDATLEAREVRAEVEKTREQRRAISSKYAGGGRRVDDEERDRMSLLEHKERVMARREEALRSAAGSWLAKCFTCLTPFTLVFGIACMLLTLFIIVSMTLSSIDRMANSYCSAGCGFLLKYPRIFNPIDELLLMASRVFPVDYAVFSALLLYIIVATLAGIARVGIRFLWIRLFRFRAGRTLPQGLIFACIIVVMSLLSFNFQLYTLTPQYLQFGSQSFINANGTRVQCSTAVITEVGRNCTMTQMGTFLTRLSLRLVFFGESFYWAGWGFIAAWLVGLVIAIITRKPSTVAEHDDEDDLYDD